MCSKFFSKDKTIKNDSTIKLDNKQEIFHPNVILERPIKNKEDDKFNVSPYVEQLKKACEEGATFIAVDGKFGSGKSSIVEMFKKDVENKYNIFVKINFMNINSVSDESKITEQLETKTEQNKTQKTDNKEELKMLSNGKKYDDISIREVVDNYHRYFVNQVINDICKNPYEFEKLFYNQVISYTTVNFNKKTEISKKIKKIIDKILLVLISFISVYMIYGNFIKDEKNILGYIHDKLNPFFDFILLITFILLILYGYGFYKPDKNIKSPMLDIDKCRNNFLKVINDYLNKNSTLYLIIDDLDRVKNTNLQLKIISLLFNEYYPLNKLINNIELKFIFMIDIEKISWDEELKPQKMFDYILQISNNQATVLKRYIGKLIEENPDLTEIFDVENYEYYIGKIVLHFNNMRDIKHLMNKIITKNFYMKQKEIKYKYDELIIISILTSLYSDNEVANAIESALNKTNKSNVPDEIFEMIGENVKSKVIEKNYYIYMYNFIDQTDLLFNSENTIFNIMINTEFNYITTEKVSDIYLLLDSNNTRINRIYEECYKYLGKNKKIILLGNKKFYNFIRNNGLIDKEVLYNSYLNKYIYDFYDNIRYKLSEQDKTNIIEQMNMEYNKCANDDMAYDELLLSVVKFITNLRDYITDFDVGHILSFVIKDEQIFDLLLNTNKDNCSILYELIIKRLIDINLISNKIDEEFIKTMRAKNAEISIEIEKIILNSNVSDEIKLYIIVTGKQKSENIKEAFEKFEKNNDFNITIDDLSEIISKYNYSSNLDKYIIPKFDDLKNRTKMIEIIKSNELNLSDEVLNKLNTITQRYGFNKYYEELFKSKEYYNLYIYSQAINKKEFKLDVSLTNKPKYKKELFEVYKNMGSVFKKYEFTKGFTNKIVNEIDFSKMEYDNDNFWKINILIPSIKSPEMYIKIFECLNKNNKINQYLLYCKNDESFEELEFLNQLSSYAAEMGPSLKANITKTINTVRKRIYQ